VAVSVFLDTSVLIAGLIDFGPQSAPSQAIMHAVAERTIPSAGTAWHCCLEFYSVATRLTPEYRLSAADAAQLLHEEIFGRMTVHELAPGERATFLRNAVQDATAGGRIYDAHIAEVARAAGTGVIVTDNRRHFLTALRHGIRVKTPGEFAASVKTRKGFA
jgi:predicted nucleic acid-binding protein